MVYVEMPYHGSKAICLIENYKSNVEQLVQVLVIPVGDTMLSMAPKGLVLVHLSF